MATARCYTKSGSVEKYESNLWSSPSTSNWSSIGIVGKITTPDSNGNYTVTPAPGYGDANGQTEFYCYTMYGGIEKTFYFKESIREIWLHAGIAGIEALTNTGLSVFLGFSNNEYLGNDKLKVKVKITVNNPTTLIDHVFFTVNKNSQQVLTIKISIKPNYDRTYSAEIVSCYPMRGKNYRVTINN